jgi:hypothetical protein
MTANVGTVDRIVRLVIGFLLLGYAMRIGFADTGWNWVGWIGVIPILTAIFAYCPLYSFLGFSTCPLAHR